MGNTSPQRERSGDAEAAAGGAAQKEEGGANSSSRISRREEQSPDHREAKSAGMSPTRPGAGRPAGMGPPIRLEKKNQSSRGLAVLLTLARVHQRQQAPPGWRARGLENPAHPHLRRRRWLQRIPRHCPGRLAVFTQVCEAPTSSPSQTLNPHIARRPSGTVLHRGVC